MGLLKRWQPLGGIGVHQSRTNPGQPITNREVAENELKHLVKASKKANSQRLKAQKMHSATNKDYKASLRTGDRKKAAAAERKLDEASVVLAEAGQAAAQAKADVIRAAKALKRIQN